MKFKLIVSSLIIFCFIVNSIASVSLIMPHRSGNNGTQITIPVKVKDFQDIISAQGTIQFDQTILSFVSIQQYGLPDMNAGTFGTSQAGSGKLTFAWFDNSLTGIDAADSTTIFSITFNIIGTGGQVSNLSFVNSPALLEIVDITYTPQTVITSNGSVTVTSIVSTPDLSLYADTITAAAGAQVSVSVRAVDFTNINACQGTLQFNPAIATFAGISYFGLPSMNISNFGTSQVGSGKLMFSWNDGTLNGQNMADSAALFTVLFDLNGVPGSFTNIDFVNTPTVVEFADSLFQVLDVATTSGRIKIAEETSTQQLTYFCDTISAPWGSTVTVSWHATDFTDIISLQGTLQFNTAIAVFDTIDFYGLPDMTFSSFGLTQVAGGKLMISWSDPTLTGVTMPDSAILFSMKFHLTGTPGTFTMLDFVNVPTPMETVNKDFLVISDSLISGKITIVNDGTLTADNPVILAYCAGEALTTGYSVTGTYIAGNLFILQLSDNTGSFATPTNIDTVIGITSGMFSCNLPLSLAAGTAYRIRVVSTNPVLTSIASTQDITIFATPSIPSLPSGSTELCLNPANTGYSSSATNVTSSTWILYPASAGIITGSGATATVDWTDTYTGTAYIKIMGFNGSCPGPWSDSLMVTLSDYPDAAMIPSGDTLMCQNPGSTAYSTPLITNADSYLWQLNPGTAGTITGTGNNITISWNPAFTGIAQLTVQGVHAVCNGALSPALSIHIIAAPVQANIPTGTSALCFNASNTTYTTNPVSGATSYLWNLYPAAAGVITPAGTSAEVDWDNSFIGQAKIVVAAINATCQGATSDTLFVTLSDVPSQAAQPTGTSEYCAGVTSSNYTTAGATGATTYTWGLWPAAAGTITGTGSSATINWTIGWTGMAWVFVAGNNLCGSGINADSLAITIHALPAAPVITTNFGTLSSSYLTGNQWYFNGTLLTGETGQDYSPSVNGNYHVVYTDGNGCWSSSDTLNVNFVGIAAYETSEKIGLMPNPSSGVFKVFAPEILCVEIMGADGNLLYKNEVLHKESLQVDFTGRAPGLYLIRVQTRNTVKAFRLIVE